MKGPHVLMSNRKHARVPVRGTMTTAIQASRRSAASAALLALVCASYPATARALPSARISATPSTVVRAAQESAARMVRGEVVFDGTGAPVAGALVVLLVEGEARARTLTDEAGAFALRAVAVAGAVGVRVDVIGRPSVHVGVGPDEQTVRVIVPARTVDPGGAAAAADAAQCMRAPAAGQTAGVLWAEVRKALAIEAWGREAHLFSYDLFQFERQLDPGGRIEAARGRHVTQVVGGPSRSRTPAEIAADGYARRTERGDILFAPDAEILLSPVFEETHCFRVQAGDRSRIGLAFEPSPGARDRVDIRGVFWLDRSTAELRSVDFEFAGLAATGAVRPGGSLEYARIARGYWVQSRWLVRTPVPGPERNRAREEGVEVVRVVHTDGTPMPVLARAALVGILTDSVGGAPVAGATVQLAGTDYHAVTNAEGRFFIPELPGGHYRLTLLDAGGEPGSAPPPDVRLVPNQATHLDVRLHARTSAPEPSAAPRFTALDSVRFYLNQLGLTATQRVDSLILEGLRDDRTGALVGRVTDAGTGRPVGGVLLRLESARLRAVSESNGTFAFAEVPAGRHVLTTEMLGYAARTDTLRVVPGEIIEASVGLTTNPIALAPIEVTVRSRWLDTNGFYTRRSGGLAGHFFNRADIERKAPAVFTDLLRDLPGVLVLSRGVGTSSVYFRRVTTISTDEGARGCEPAIYYDGIPMNLGFDRLHEIAIPFIDGVEVYVGAATPIRFQHPCGVVLIWTRRPR